MADEEKACAFDVVTKYGEVLIVDQAKNYRDSKRFCEEELNGKLPTIHNKTMTADLKAHLSACRARGHHGNAYSIERDTKMWRVGLLYDDKAGKWSDGRDYDYDDDLHIFRSSANVFSYGYCPDPENGCQNAAINGHNSWYMTYDGLEAISCADEHPFLCLREAPAANETVFKGVADDSADVKVVSIAAAAVEEPSALARAYTSPVVIGLTIGAALLLILHVFFIARNSYRRRRKYKGVAVAKEEIELDEMADSKSNNPA